MNGSKPSDVIGQLFSVEGKTALVTGAASGIGQQLALFLGRVGANLVLLDRQEEKLQLVTDEIRKIQAGGSGKVMPILLDLLTSEESIDSVVEKAWQAFGRIDILVNNAGVFVPATTAVDATVEDFDLMFGVNVKAMWLMAKAVGKRQRVDGKGGAIVNLSSICASETVPTCALYSGTKGAVANLTKHLARELGPYNIRVNAIAPGKFPTAIMDDDMELLDTMMKKIPLERKGDTTKELNGTLLLLVSEAGSYITGASMAVDGGFGLASWMSI